MPLIIKLTVTLLTSLPKIRHSTKMSVSIQCFFTLELPSTPRPIPQTASIQIKITLARTLVHIAPHYRQHPLAQWELRLTL
jgi:hypothetical protein